MGSGKNEGKMNLNEVMPEDKKEYPKPEDTEKDNKKN